MGDTQCKISAYADDLLFSLSNPTISLQNLLKEFDTYGALSNLKINFTKSAAMGIAIAPLAMQSMQASFRFKWTSVALKYLGMNIPIDIKRTYELNSPPILTKARSLLENWNRGLHSWFGRCNLIKMCILPKFLYLLQALPVHIPHLFFKQVHALFTRFIWANKKPCIRRTMLSLPKQYGGLALPDIRQYFLATQLGPILDWRRNAKTKLWVRIEQAQTDIPLKSAFWCYDLLPSGLKTHPLLGTTLRYSSQVSIQYSLTSNNSPLYPILGNPNFAPGIHSIEFDSLRRSGFDHAAKFVTDGRWPTVPELTNATGMYQLPFWKAVKVHHFLHSIPNPQDFSRQLTTFEEYCTGNEPLAKTLSKMYMLLNTPSTQPHLPCLVRCERDLNHNFSEIQKQKIINCAPKYRRRTIKF